MTKKDNINTQENKKEACIPCRISVALGITRDICKELKGEEKCKEFSRKILNGEMSLGKFIEELQKEKVDTDTKTTLEALSIKLKEWNIYDQQIQFQLQDQ